MTKSFKKSIIVSSTDFSLVVLISQDFQPQELNLLKNEKAKLKKLNDKPKCKKLNE